LFAMGQSWALCAGNPALSGAVDSVNNFLKISSGVSLYLTHHP
jgi:hypothetical protein